MKYEERQKQLRSFHETLEKIKKDREKEIKRHEERMYGYAVLIDLTEKAMKELSTKCFDIKTEEEITEEYK